MIVLTPMQRADDEWDRVKASVLLFTEDQFKGRSYVAALEKATVPVEWVTTTSAFRSRLNRADLPPPALIMMLPSPQTSMPPGELASVALRLTTGTGDDDLGPQKTTSALAESLNDYCAARSLSGRQRQVLALYLTGNNDKEIACSFNCSATTVYEHWRRMAKKANGVHKSDVVNDFHRFLATRSDAVNPRLPNSLAALRRSTRQPGT
jgi:DNA-binding CsgD family transcriptional regulator